MVRSLYFTINNISFMKDNIPRLTKFDSIDKLPSKDANCVKQAIEYLGYAYAPYSNFLVGASVMMADGTLYGGANQENASYPLCMCAERVALYHAAMMERSQKISCIAITAKHHSKKLIDPAMPCGACRQVINEYESINKAKIKIYLINDNQEVYMIDSIKPLLPYSFDGSVLDA